MRISKKTNIKTAKQGLNKYEMTNTPGGMYYNNPEALDVDESRQRIFD